MNSSLFLRFSGMPFNPRPKKKEKYVGACNNIFVVVRDMQKWSTARCIASIACLKLLPGEVLDHPLIYIVVQKDLRQPSGGLAA